MRLSKAFRSFVKKRHYSNIDGLVRSPVLVILNEVKDLELIDLVRFFASLRMTGLCISHFLRIHQHSIIPIFQLFSDLFDIFRLRVKWKIADGA
jgi:hypothetical protein